MTTAISEAIRKFNVSADFAFDLIEQIENCKSKAKQKKVQHQSNIYIGAN